MLASTAADYGKLAKTGRVLRDSLKNAESIKITGPGRTDMTIGVTGKRWYLSDGVVDEEDIRNDDLNDQLPAGTVYTAPMEDSADGGVTFNAGTPLMGRKVTGLQLTFKHGKIVNFKGNASTVALKKNWEEGTGDKSNIAYFGIGFNPKAETGYTVNNVAYGAVSLGFGGNEFFGGNNKSGFFHLDTITGATVKADGRTILRGGKLVTD